MLRTPRISRTRLTHRQKSAFACVAMTAVAAASLALTPPPLGNDPEHDLPPVLEVWDFGDPAGTAARFQDLAQRARTAGAEIYRAEAVTQIARCRGLMGDFEAAHALLDSARTLPGSDHPRVRVRLALEQGRALNSGGDPEGSLALFTEAWELGHAEGEEYLAGDAAHMAAIVAPLEQAEAWTHRGRAFALAAADTTARHWLGPLHNNLGWRYYESKRYEDALEQFRLSGEAYAAEAGAEVSELIARYSVGKALRALERHREAVQTQETVRDAFAARGEEDGYVLEELAEGYKALGRVKASREAAARAHDLLSQDSWIVKNEPERLERLAALAGRK